jgi:hypothetical protein
VEGASVAATQVETGDTALPPWLVDGAEVRYELTAADAEQIMRQFALAEPQAAAMRPPGGQPPPTLAAGEVYPARVWQSESGGLNLSLDLTPGSWKTGPCHYGYERPYPGDHPGRITPAPTAP